MYSNAYMSFFKDPCEWNPEANSPALNREAHAEAQWIFGQKSKWRLCNACSKLSYFRRVKVRIKIDK